MTTPVSHALTFAALLSFAGLAAACGNADAPAGASSAASAKAAPSSNAAPPADATTVAAFGASTPSKGSRAKIHGFLGSVSGKDWVVVDKASDTLPFVFCRMDKAPEGFAKGARVVIEGVVEDSAMLNACTVKAL